MTKDEIIDPSLDSLAKAGIYSSFFAICLIIFLFYSLVNALNIGIPPVIKHMAAYICLITFDLFRSWFTGATIVKVVLFWYFIVFIIAYIFIFLKNVFILKKNVIDGNTNDVKCPRGFIFLSLYFSYSSVTAIGTTFYYMISSDSLTMISALLYGLSAMALAVGLCYFRPWTFYAAIVNSILSLIRCFNMQYNMYKKYSLTSIDEFIPYIIIIPLLILMLFYIRKKFKE